MQKQNKKCVSCDHAMYKSAIGCNLKDAKRGELCLYCAKHHKVIGERYSCGDWSMVKGNI